MLERAIANLLDNALKYADPDSPVDVVVDGTSVEVRDHGPGIDPADQPLVFDRFYRAATRAGRRAQVWGWRSCARSSSGTGARLRGWPSANINGLGASPQLATGDGSSGPPSAYRSSSSRPPCDAPASSPTARRVLRPATPTAAPTS